MNRKLSGSVAFLAASVAMISVTRANPAANAGPFTEANAEACLAMLDKNPFNFVGGKYATTADGQLRCQVNPAIHQCTIEPQRYRQVGVEDTNRPQLTVTPRGIFLTYVDEEMEYAVAASRLLGNQIRLYKKRPLHFEGDFGNAISPSPPPKDLENTMPPDARSFSRWWINWASERLAQLCPK